MGKNFEINISDYLFDIIMKPIRKKEDIAILLLETIKAFLLGNIISDIDSKGKIILNINKMSRLIFKTSDKYFSFNFPFSVEKIFSTKDHLRIYDSNFCITLDSKIIAVLLSLFREDILAQKSLDELYDHLYDSQAEIEEYDIDSAWLILKKIIMFESGYLRYDYDEEHQNGLLHPLNHLDIYYSSNNTFKLGLDTRISINKFIDILDVDTNCHFLRIK